jgi:hypothetical protein
MGAVFLLQQFYSSIYSFFIDGQKSEIPHMQKFSINRNIIRFTDAMTAVSLHNIKHFKTGIFKEELRLKIRNHKLPLLFLLILCDELQAWDRDLSPPEEQTRLSISRFTRDKKPDKNVFIEHYKTLYREYASAKKEDKELEFYVPFWEDDEDDDSEYKRFLIANFSESPPYALKIKFTRKSPYALKRWLSDDSKNPEEQKIDKKVAGQMEKDAWKSFKRQNITLGKFIEMVFGLKKFLSNFSLCSRENYNNNITVRGMETLTGDILPPLTLLKKGQDILSPFLRPYHFYDIHSGKKPPSKQMGAPGTAAGKKENHCTLLLHYPGKEVDDFEGVIKERISKKLYGGEEKEMALKYADAPETSLNRVINETYIPGIEEYIYGIQMEKFIVVELIGGKNGPK